MKKLDIKALASVKGGTFFYGGYAKGGYEKGGYAQKKSGKYC